MAASNILSACRLNVDRSVWFIGVHQLDLWVEGVRPICCFVLDDVTREVLSSVAVKDKSTEALVGLVESALVIRSAPGSIRMSDLDLVRDADFQDWASGMGIRVSCAFQSQSVSHLA